MEKNLPGIVTTITRGLGSFDHGDVFSTRTFRSKTTQMRIDAQKELYMKAIESKTSIEITKLEADKQIEIAKVEAGKELEALRMKYEYEFKKVQLEILSDMVRHSYECDDYSDSRVSSIGSVISGLQ